MKANYVVIDETGNVSCSDDGEAQSFSTFNAAEKRAQELAAVSPGQTIGIYELTGEVKVPVGTVESHRKHPIEHYK